jgi:hypothetical protein
MQKGDPYGFYTSFPDGHTLHTKDSFQGQEEPVIYARAVFVGDLVPILSAIIVCVKKIAQS